VEGLGHATIHDVTIATIPTSANPTISDKLEDLLRQKQKTEQAINRCNLAAKSLETYISTLNVKDVGVTEVPKIVKGYQSTGGELDNELTELQEQLKRLDEDITAERSTISTGTVDDEKLRMRVSVSLFADGGEVEIRLTYGLFLIFFYAKF
jgi:peptidoglycan hydrolase CwlO-like protein